MAQQARPNWSGHTEFFRPQLYSSCRVVVKIPCLLNSLLSPSSIIRKVFLLWLINCPVLRPPAVLPSRTGEFKDVGHVEAHFALDDFTQGDVRCAEMVN